MAHKRILKIAWAAGFFDGEGFIQISRGFLKRQGWGPYYQMQISVSQIVREPLDELVRLFGGTVYPQRKRNLFTWACTSRNAFPALVEMIPFLRVKREQALLAIKFQKRRKKGGTRKANRMKDEADWRQLSVLKDKHRTIPRNK